MTKTTLDFWAAWTPYQTRMGQHSSVHQLVSSVCRCLETLLREEMLHCGEHRPVQAIFGPVAVIKSKLSLTSAVPLWIKYWFIRFTNHCVLFLFTVYRVQLRYSQPSCTVSYYLLCQSSTHWLNLCFSQNLRAVWRRDVTASTFQSKASEMNILWCNLESLNRTQQISLRCALVATDFSEARSISQNSHTKPKLMRQASDLIWSSSVSRVC